MTGTNCDLFTHKSVPVIFEPPCTDIVFRVKLEATVKVLYQTTLYQITF